MNAEFTIDPELMRNALGASMRNPELQRIFKEAPQAAKPVLKLKFAAMVFPDQISDEAFGTNLEELAKSLGADDLRYLISTETDAGTKAYFEGLARAGNARSQNTSNGNVMAGTKSRFASATGMHTQTGAREKPFATEHRKLLIGVACFAFLMLVVGAVAYLSGTHTRNKPNDEATLPTGMAANDEKADSAKIKVESTDTDDCSEDFAEENNDPPVQKVKEVERPEKCRVSGEGSVAERLLASICAGKRFTKAQWEKIIEKLTDQADARLRNSGYSASGYTTDDGGFYVAIWSPREGQIRKGLAGGITYPTWLPENEAVCIWNEYYLIHQISQDFYKSRSFITPEEEAREEERRTRDPNVQAQRKKYAKTVFARLNFEIEKAVVLCKGPFEVRRAYVTSSDWGNLKDAASREDWLALMNVGHKEKLEYLPKEEDIRFCCEGIMSRKWRYQIEYSPVGYDANFWSAFKWWGRGEWRETDEFVVRYGILDKEESPMVGVEFTMRNMPYTVLCMAKDFGDREKKREKFMKQMEQVQNRIEKVNKKNAGNYKEAKRLENVEIANMFKLVEGFSQNTVAWPITFNYNVKDESDIGVEEESRKEQSEQRSRSREMMGLTSVQKKRFASKTAQEIHETISRESQEATDRAHREGVRRDLAEQRQNLLDQMTPSERRAVKGKEMTNEQLANWLQNKRQQDLDRTQRRAERSSMEPSRKSKLKRFRRPGDDR